MKKRLFFGVILLTALALGILFYPNSNVQADDARVVTVHVDGETKTIATKAETVQATIDRLGIELHERDKTEPALDQPIQGADFTVNIYRARPITVIDGANHYTVVTAERSPAAIAKDAGFETKQEDDFNFRRSEDSFVGMPGTQMVIKRARTITFSLYGVSSELSTRSETVADLLTEKNVSLEANDELNVSPQMRIIDGMMLSIDNVTRSSETIEEEIAFPEEKIQDAQQPTTYREIKEPGKNGRKLVTYETVSRNGGASQKVVVKEVVTKEPVKQVVTVGVKLPTPANPTEAQELGRQMMLAAGFGEDHWPCLYNLWMRESGWRTNAGNPISGAYGIPQSLPASKMASAGPDYLTNAETQIRWGLGYIKGRYGTPCGAWAAFQSKGWY